MGAPKLFGSDKAADELKKQQEALDRENALIEEEEARKKEIEAERAARTRRGGGGQSELNNTLG
jgi:hypothetical protein